MAAAPVNQTEYYKTNNLQVTLLDLVYFEHHRYRPKRVLSGHARSRRLNQKPNMLGKARTSPTHHHTYKPIQPNNLLRLLTPNHPL